MTDREAARADYERELKEMFADMTDADIEAEHEQAIAWRRWVEADSCYDELARRRREREAAR